MAKKKAKSLIPIPRELQGKIRFSFEFYDKSSKYCLSDWQKKDIATTLTRLSEMCEKTYGEIMQSAKVYHFHPVDWSKTQEPDGFPSPKAMALEPFQFSVVGVNNQKARVFGAYSSGTFYIVWFDFDHKIWPSFIKHT